MNRSEEFLEATAKILNGGTYTSEEIIAIELIALNQTMALIYDHMSNEKAAADGEKNE